LTNHSRHPIRIVATGEGAVNVEFVVCNGSAATPYRVPVDYLAHPSGAYSTVLRALAPGERVSFPIRIVRYDWGKRGDAEIYYRLSAPGQCRVRFTYTSPAMTGESFTSASNEVAIDVEP
jgi:hypothetical protein